MTALLVIMLTTQEAVEGVAGLRQYNQHLIRVAKAARGKYLAFQEAVFFMVEVVVVAHLEQTPVVLLLLEAVMVVHLEQTSEQREQQIQAVVVEVVGPQAQAALAAQA